MIPILSEGIGYGILFGVGLVMAIVVTALISTESKWLGTKKTFEWFYTAVRNEATFFAEYLNSAFIFGVILIFVVVIYFTNHDVGGISGLYHKLTTAAIFKPVPGNSGGSFLTIVSSGALIFG